MSNLKLIISIINYLKEEAKKPSMNADTQESLEVAVQCLQTAYDLDPKDPRINTSTACALSLADIFMNACPEVEEEGDEVPPSTSRDTTSKAEIMKNLGNNLMRSDQYAEAIRYYTAAIEIDGSVAVYYCNRAAAYSKINEFQKALKDCEKAVEIDPNYAKAYGRMGLAYASLEQSDLAIKAFQKSVDIEPDNESYQTNLRIALARRDSPGGTAGLAAGLSSVDWHSLFSNPAFRNMASSIMQDPNIISALSAGMSSSLNNMAAGSASAGETTNPPNAGAASNRSFDMLLEAGQYLAAQMQAANPDLADQFRQANPRNMNPGNPENKDSSAK